MKNEFYGKRIAFLGDSIIQDGTFLDFMRARLLGVADAPRLYNRGLGGNRAMMVEGLFADEIASLRPDVCYIHYGVNDVGIWLYDTSLPITPPKEEERRGRLEDYCSGLTRAVERMLAEGITPVICTPIALDEQLGVEDSTKTVTDNDGKAEHVKEVLYKRKTFSHVNRALRAFCDFAASLAKRYRIGLLDLHDAFLRAQAPEATLYRADGIHLSAVGNRLLAKLLLAHFGIEEKIPEGAGFPPAIATLREVEQTERRIQYVKWAMFHPIYGRAIEDPEVGAAALLSRESLEQHKRLAIETYLAHGKSAEALRAKIEEIYP